MTISEQDKERILKASQGKLLEVISDFSSTHKSGASILATCPACGAEKGLSISPNKDGGVFKCFKCNSLSGKTAVDYLMKGQGKSFKDSMIYLAERFNIIILKEQVKVNKPLKTRKEKRIEQSNFCSKMLIESGITPEDTIIPEVILDKDTIMQNVKTFCPGSVDSKGNRVAGDDCLIDYYDLDCKPIMYDFKYGKTSQVERRPYFRVRWQFPHEHKDKEGKENKYKSPYGSGTPIYIPQRIREAYQAEKKIERLFIQEGEKKAEKACKHGVLSVGISGIQNIALNGALPEDLIRIIEKCKVQEVCFLLDSDWNELSHNIKISDPVDRRPRNFFYAVKNFKEYMRTLVNRNIYVEIYFGYVLQNEAKDKGIDDLLTNTLKDKEHLLLEDINKLINAKDKKGQFLQLNKITSISDQKLEEFWSLNSAKKFAATHINILKDLPEFLIGRHRWRFNEKLELESAQPIETDEQYWEEIEKVTRSGRFNTEYEFRYVRCRRFLENRGFGRYRMLDGKEAFVRVTSPTVKLIDSSEARDFLFEFTEANCNEGINEMISKGVSQYVGPDKLRLLRFMCPTFLKPTKDTQYFYFKQTCWKVTENSISEIDYSQITHHIWQEQKKEFPASKLPDLIKVECKDDVYSYEITSEGKKCHFLQFLENTSRFTWRKEKMIEDGDDTVKITREDFYENTLHFLSKLCALGYLALEYKDPSVAKAVCGMDGKQSAVGDSNGRSGKSLLGELIKQIMKTAAINGKKRDMDTDTFIWNDVDESTKAVFIDDVRQGYVFEDLFFNITGDWSVNYKGGRRMTIPFENSPKIYLTTNHALKGDDDSHRDRQWKIAFCDFYNSNHKPIDDFGLRFFSDWDFEQWNLCWNMVAKCVQLYLQFGVIEAPGERLEQRQLRQEITEDFISWADEYFSSEENINHRLVRKDLTDKFFEYAPLQRKYITATEFKKKIIKYCKWKGYVFNPQRYDRVTGKPIYFDQDGRPDIDDKSGGIEYFTLANKNWNEETDENINSDNLLKF